MARFNVEFINNKLEIMEKYRDTLVFFFRVPLMGAIALLIAYLMK